MSNTIELKIDNDCQEDDAYRIHVMISKDENGFSASALNLPGAEGCGDTLDEAVIDLRSACVELLKTYAEDAMEIPWRDSATIEVPFGCQIKYIYING